MDEMNCTQSSIIRMIGDLMAMDQNAPMVRCDAKSFITMLSTMMAMCNCNVMRVLSRLTICDENAIGGTSCRWDERDLDIMVRAFTFDPWIEVRAQMLSWACGHFSDRCITDLLVSLRGLDDRDHYIDALTMITTMNLSDVYVDGLIPYTMPVTGAINCAWPLPAIMAALENEGFDPFVTGEYVAHCCNPAYNPTYERVELSLFVTENWSHYESVIAKVVYAIVKTHTDPVPNMDVSGDCIEFTLPGVTAPLRVLVVCSQPGIGIVNVLSWADLDPCCACIALNDACTGIEYWLHPRAERAYRTGTMSLYHQPSRQLFDAWHGDGNASKRRPRHLRNHIEKTYANYVLTNSNFMRSVASQQLWHMQHHDPIDHPFFSIKCPCDWLSRDNGETPMVKCSEIDWSVSNMYIVKSCDDIVEMYDENNNQVMDMPMEYVNTMYCRLEFNQMYRIGWYDSKHDTYAAIIIRPCYRARPNVIN